MIKSLISHQYTSLTIRITLEKKKYGKIYSSVCSEQMRIKKINGKIWRNLNTKD